MSEEAVKSMLLAKITKHKLKGPFEGKKGTYWIQEYTLDRKHPKFDTGKFMPIVSRFGKEGGTWLPEGVEFTFVLEVERWGDDTKGGYNFRIKDVISDDPIVEVADEASPSPQAASASAGRSHADNDLILRQVVWKGLVEAAKVDLGLTRLGMALGLTEAGTRGLPIAEIGRQVMARGEAYIRGGIKAVVALDGVEEPLPPVEHEE